MPLAATQLELDQHRQAQEVLVPIWRDARLDRNEWLRSRGRSIGYDKDIPIAGRPALRAWQMERNIRIDSNDKTNAETIFYNNRNARSHA